MEIKYVKAQSTHIPLSIIGSAVIAIIFAMSVMEFPKTIATFLAEIKIGQSGYCTIVLIVYLIRNSWMYTSMYMQYLLVFFTWFYTQITFKPDEMAENLHKSAGFVPGVRPGEETSNIF